MNNQPWNPSNQPLDYAHFLSSSSTTFSLASSLYDIQSPVPLSEPCAFKNFKRSEVHQQFERDPCGPEVQVLHAPSLHSRLSPRCASTSLPFACCFLLRWTDVSRLLHRENWGTDAPAADSATDMKCFVACLWYIVVYIVQRSCLRHEAPGRILESRIVAGCDFAEETRKALRSMCAIAWRLSSSYLEMRVGAETIWGY